VNRVDQPIIILESVQHLVPNILGMILTAGAVGAFWGLRCDPRAGIASWISALASLWNLGAVLMRISGQAWLGIVGYEMTAVAGLYASALMLPLAMRQADSTKALSPFWVRLLLLVPALILAIKWSTDLLTLGYTFEPGPPVSFAWPIHGPFAGFEHTIGYVSALVGATLLAQAWSAATNRVQRNQCAALIGLILLPMFGSIVQTSQHGSGWTRQVSIAGLTLAACNLGYLWLLRRGSHFSLMPIARDVVIESMQDGVLVSDASGNVVDVNAAAVRMLSVESESACVGKPAHDLLSGAGFSIPLTGEVHTLDRDGTVLELRIATIRNHQLAIGQAFQIRDITEANRAHAELKRAKALAEQAAVAKAEFLATMSHEIRTPLNGVMGMATLILDEPLTPSLRRRMETLHVSAQSLRSLLDDILDLSRIDSGRMRLEETAFSVEDVASEVTALFRAQAAAKGVQLRVILAEDLPKAVWGDTLRLRQIIANLVGNAVKFTAKGYVLITLDAKLDESCDKAWVSICVRDTGIGIPGDQLGKLFERFVQGDASTTRRFGGTGLGLSICKKLVDLMGGSIRAKSQQEVGSEFTVEIPLRLAPNGSDRKAEGDIPLAPLYGRILLAEDNAVNQLVATGLLQKLGCSVDLALNGREAVELAASNHYDSILMDCHMPEVDGYEAAEALRRNGSTTPIIALTASVLPGDRERCLQAGMNGFVPKPIELAELHRALQHHMQKVNPAADSPSDPLPPLSSPAAGTTK
jgi:signal transduction histidine kinase/ActR/RegA family two-component response regulator